MERKKGVFVLFTLLVCVCLSSLAQAGTIYARRVGTSFLMTVWYDYTGGTSGHINFNPTTINGENKIFTYDDVYTLSITGTLTFAPNLTRDYSSDRAKGIFEGGVDVTITGGLKVVGGSGSYVYGGTGAAAKQILKAVVLPLYEDSQNPTLNRWSFEEQTNEEGRFDKTLLLQIVSGSEGLASGITIGSDILKMADPTMHLSLKANSATNFYMDLGPSALGSVVEFTALIPEPATMMLLGLGVLLVNKKR